ncbi:lipid A biosynthesis lauroyl acyltransferase [Stappia sp. 22II-S9-Z10]|nr:lipid A biosynthesis lauroyl acyltransferase [Stappia sp. 22II-S9-Z10]
MRNSEIPWAATYAPEPVAPPLGDLFSSDPALKKAARRFHVADRVYGGGKVALHRLFKLLSPEAGSHLAGRIVAPRSRRFYGEKPFIQRMDRMIGRLRPALADDPAARSAIIDAWFENTARAMAEFSQLEAVATPPRTTVEGLDIVRRLQAEGRSTVITTVHTGMWEMVSYNTSRHFNDLGTGAWAPQTNRFENRIVATTRHKLGIKVLPATPKLARQLFRILSVPGQTIVLVIDELSEKQVKFPLFGRPIEEKCNFAFALYMAQRTKAAIVPVTITRTGPTRFTYRYCEPIEVGPGAEGFQAAGQALNAVYEPHVLAHLEQWYMLHELKLP